MMSDMKWENIDYDECLLYIALNWSEEKCNSSSLKMYLPTRSKKKGPRPAIRGKGPKDLEKGGAWTVGLQGHPFDLPG